MQRILDRVASAAYRRNWSYSGSVTSHLAAVTRAVEGACIDTAFVGSVVGTIDSVFGMIHPPYQSNARQYIVSPNVPVGLLRWPALYRDMALSLFARHPPASEAALRAASLAGVANELGHLAKPARRGVVPGDGKCRRPPPRRREPHRRSVAACRQPCRATVAPFCSLICIGRRGNGGRTCALPYFADRRLWAAILGVAQNFSVPSCAATPVTSTERRLADQALGVFGNDDDDDDDDARLKHEREEGNEKKSGNLFAETAFAVGHRFGHRAVATQ